MRGRDFVIWGVVLLALIWFVRSGRPPRPEPDSRPAHVVITPSTYGTPGPTGGAR